MERNIITNLTGLVISLQIPVCIESLITKKEQVNGWHLGIYVYLIIAKKRKITFRDII